jgi:cytochrome c553
MHSIQFAHVFPRLVNILILAGLILLCSGFNTAMSTEEPVPVDGIEGPDMEYGEEINELCAGCHGEFGQGSGDGEYPRLAGMDRQYLARQLQYFKDRSRLNIPMLPYATERELPEKDVQAVSAFLSSIQLPTKLAPVDESNFDAYARLLASKRVLNIARYPGDEEQGRRLYSRECASCHGNDGMGKPAKLAPRLVGQHSIYIKRQMEQIASGKRLHDVPDDAEVFSQYSDAEIDNLLAWLSVQDD